MNYKTKEEVQQRVQEHYDWAVKEGYEVMGVFLQGSWNYSDLLCDEESDVDTKCWVLPTLEDLALNKKPLSFTHVFENDEHCDVKDFRLYVDCFRKQNVNFVEVLFTDYYVLNPKYKDVFSLLLENRETVAHYNEVATVNCMLGMAFQKQKALCHPYEGLKEKLAKYGYDGKQLSHCLRMSYMLENYLNGKSYSECLKMNDEQAKTLLALKRHLPFDGHPALTKDEAKNLMDELVNTMKATVDKVKKQLKPVNQEVNTLFNELLVESFRKNIEG